MEFISTTLIAFGIIMLCFWYLNAKPANFPPGPIGLPIVGYLPFLGKYPYKTFMKLARKYGNLFSVRLGHQNVVVLNDWEAIKEALIDQAEVFNGRPKSEIAAEVFHNADIIFTDGPPWREKRRITLNHLKNFGFGKSIMETTILEEINKLIDNLKVDGKNSLVIKFDYFFPYFMNVIWSVVGKKVFEAGEFKPEKNNETDFLKHLAYVGGIISDTLTNTNASIYMPYLMHAFPGELRKLKKAAMANVAFLDHAISEHLDTYQEGNPRDLIDAYLKEILKNEKSKEQNEVFTRKSLIQISQDLFLAGTDTSNKSLLWGLLYMATWPTIQQKVHQEIDEVLGRQRLPCYQDREVLKYTTAVIYETMRYSTIVNLSVPHRTTSTTQIRGYTVPKDTTVLPNLWAVHHDPRYWKDPEVFRPERFLDDKGDLQKPEYFIPFSVGGRTCLGKSLAQMNAFLFFACLMHQFSFSLNPGERPPNLEPANYSAVLGPRPFSLRVTAR